MPTQEVVQCRMCRSQVRADRLSSHLRRVHAASGTEPLLPPSAPLPPELLTVACSCGGTNENCFRCGGWGYIDSIGKGRAAPPDFVAGGSSVVDRARARRAQPPSRPKPLLPFSCPQCGVGLVRLQRHMKKVHKGVATAPRRPERLQQRLADHPRSSETPHKSGTYQRESVERAHDATRLYYAAYRDNGQFGSHPSHDGYGDESDP